MPRIAGNHQKPEEARRDALLELLELQREWGLADTLIMDVGPPELPENAFLLF